MTKIAFLLRTVALTTDGGHENHGRGNPGRQNLSIVSSPTPEMGKAQTPICHHRLNQILQILIKDNWLNVSLLRNLQAKPKATGQLIHDLHHPHLELLEAGGIGMAYVQGKTGLSGNNVDHIGVNGQASYRGTAPQLRTRSVTAT